MSARSNEACSACRFWDRYDQGGEYSLSKELGDCRFGPPAISHAILDRLLPTGRGAADCLDELELNVYPASAFPVTREESWCGRFERSGRELPIA